MYSAKGKCPWPIWIVFFFLIEWKTFKLIVFEDFPFSDPVQNCLKSVVMSISMSQVISCISSRFLPVFRFRNCTCRPKQYHILLGWLSPLKRYDKVSSEWVALPSRGTFINSIWSMQIWNLSDSDDSKWWWWRMGGKGGEGWILR